MNNERITGAEVTISMNGEPIAKTYTITTLEINPTPDYNVGDMVEVKTWVELKYGAERLDEDGSLILKDGVRFVVKDMAEYCGKHIVITEKRKIHDGTYRYGIEGSRYNWTESMFAEPEADKTVRTQRLLKLLVKEREEVEREIINWQGLLASDMAKLEKIEADIERLNKELNGE